MGRYLRAFTFADRGVIESLDEATAAAPERREAQRVLAREVTTAVHGPDEAAGAERAAEVLFTEEVAELEPAVLSAALADAPSSPVQLEGGLSIVDALVRTGLASSRSDAQRQIKGGGVYVNNRRQAADCPLGRQDVIGGRFILLRRGKAQQHVLHVAD